MHDSNVKKDNLLHWNRSLMLTSFLSVILERKQISVFSLCSDWLCSFCGTLPFPDFCRKAVRKLLHCSASVRGLVLLWLHEWLHLCFVEVQMLSLSGLCLDPYTFK